MWLTTFFVIVVQFAIIGLVTSFLLFAVWDWFQQEDSDDPRDLSIPEMR